MESTGEIPLPSWSASLLLGNGEQRSTYPEAVEETEHGYATSQRSAVIAVLWDRRLPSLRFGFV